MPRLVVSNTPPASRISFQMGSSALQRGRKVDIRRVVFSGSPYHIASPNNTFRLREATPATFTVTLTPGNYTGVTFVAMLQAALNGLGAANTYAVALNGDSGLLTISLGAGVTNFAFWLANEPRIAATLGFAPADPAPAGVTVTGVYPVRLSPTFYRLVSPSLSAGETGPSLTESPTIAVLAYEGGRYQSQTYEESKDTSYSISGGFDAWLVDEFGEEVNLNNGLLLVDLTVDV